MHCRWQALRHEGSCKGPDAPVAPEIKRLSSHVPCLVFANCVATWYTVNVVNAGPSTKQWYYTLHKDPTYFCQRVGSVAKVYCKSCQFLQASN